MLIALAVTLAVLPKDWIEELGAGDPDQGSGLVELLVTLVPLAIGVGLVLGGLVLARAANKDSGEQRPTAG